MFFDKILNQKCSILAIFLILSQGPGKSRKVDGSSID